MTRDGDDREPRRTLPDLVCLSHLRWDFVFQRPQHLMSRFARERRVFFVEEPVLEGDEPKLAVRRCGDTGVHVAVPFVPPGTTEAAAHAAQDALLRILFREHRIERHVLWYYTPLALPFTRPEEADAVVYDCMDELSAFAGAPPSLKARERFFASVAERRESVRTSEDVIVAKVGRELYEKFFRNYTRKQWDLDPSELDASVTARVPVRTNRDDRYFTDTDQVMPLRGYTRMFQRILDHPNIKIMLNTDYRDIVRAIPYREMIYTGPIDAYFDYCFGKLPYRSLEFRFETHDVPVFQPAPVVNYPNEYPYTRVTEFKYLTGQEHPRTTVVYEHPRASGDPYYPVPRPENGELYRRYEALAARTPKVWFVGRLATYKYYNMDQVVAQALKVYSRIVAAHPADGLAESA